MCQAASSFIASEVEKLAKELEAGDLKGSVPSEYLGYLGYVTYMRCLFTHFFATTRERKALKVRKDCPSSLMIMECELSRQILPRYRWAATRTWGR